MALSPFLLYPLLILWLLPAIVLIVIYYCDLTDAVVRRYAIALNSPRAGRAASVGADRRGRLPGFHFRERALAGSYLHIPLVIEDEAGTGYTRHWHVCLN